MANSWNTNNFHIGNYLVAMILYFVLSIFSIYYIYKVRKVIKSYHIEIKKLQQIKNSLLLISIISSIYLSQAIYGFFAIIHKNVIDSWANKKFNNENQKYYGFLFAWLTITEIFPNFMIWTVFHLSLIRTKHQLYKPLHSSQIEVFSDEEFSDSDFDSSPDLFD
ncbi:integral membrane protein [Anaeramoeba flamelloides]|uniref:Integral membrane protein n=1 Tax=Anaeramoeba flamelloides TaxID=1746091 RepID=A0AAV7ZTN5_9EUKA|nr:integral membrane protein [Anaeramoeba flamelloides]KAJ6239028.1 integral membrane protein [Anaeramoeba flamelloides]